MRLARVLNHLEAGKSLAMAHEALREAASLDDDPVKSAGVYTGEQLSKEAEKRAKDAVKRRKTLDELCETEAAYATDMAVLRDIYLERVKGLGE